MQADRDAANRRGVLRRDIYPGLVTELVGGAIEPGVRREPTSRDGDKVRRLSCPGRVMVHPSPEQHRRPGDHPSDRYDRAADGDPRAAAGPDAGLDTFEGEVGVRGKVFVGEEGIAQLLSHGCSLVM